ncbi:MAG: hypothetical protein ACLR6W_01790 [Evtepia sp.]
MTGWIVLLVLAILVLLVCLVRLGVAAGYDERGGWVKVHLGPKWVTLYPIDPHKAAKRQEKKARKAEKKAQKPTQEEPDKPTLGGALDLALDLLPDVKAAAAGSAGGCASTTSPCTWSGGSLTPPTRPSITARPGGRRRPSPPFWRPTFRSNTGTSPWI